MYIKNLKILVLLSFGFLIIALGMYFDGKNISNKSSSELLFHSFYEFISEIEYILGINLWRIWPVNKIFLFLLTISAL